MKSARNMRCAMLFICGFALSASQRLEPQNPRISASATDSHLRDSYGRVRIFHGLNAQTKGLPFYPAWMLLNTSLIDEMASWGINMVRLGWMWAGFNPSNGTYDEVYYKTMEQIVQNLAERGIYSLLDMHQDVLSSLYCSYDGVPLYVIKKSVPEHQFPWPLRGNCSSRGWMSNEITEAAGRAYQDIYDDNHGMREDLASFWEESARRWNGNTNVIGYEIINEPFAGDTFQDPELLLPGIAGKRNLQPLYNDIAQRIRLHDDQQNIFYEPVVWGMVVNGKLLGSGFTDVPGGQLYRNRSVLSYHYYCSTFGNYRKICDPVVGPAVFDAIDADVKTIGGSSFMTEWGICDHTLGECTAVMDLADKHLQSWSDDGGNLGHQSWTPPASDYINILDRSYAQAVAGIPLNMSYDQSSKQFDLCYTIDTAINAPTQVFAAFSRNYPNMSAVLSGTPNLVLAFNTSANLIMARPASSNAHGQEACIHLARKSAGPGPS